MKEKIQSFKRNIFYYFNNVILKKLIKVDIKSIDESISYVIDNNVSVSVSRFGDGELNIINSREIGFQEYDNRLRDRLKEILKSDIPGIAICIPGALNNTSQLDETPKKFWDENLKTGRFSWYKNINLKKVYYNAQMTRPYMDYKDKNQSIKYFTNLKKIWDKKNIAIIEGENSKLGVGNDLLKNTKSIERILAPSENAFKKYNEILSEAKKIDKEKLILIALGPTATVLAYDLHKLGYQAIDIGHIDIEYEWFLKKCVTKESIPGKYTNEATNKLVMYDNRDENYEEQIIVRINI